MTWIEIIFFILLLGCFIFGIVLDCSFGDGPAPECFLILPLLFTLVFGAFPCMIVDSNTPTTFVKEVPLKILSNVMVDDKMVIITDSVDKVVFSEYKDIVKVNAGKGLVKRYYRKDVYYGPDAEWNNIEIK